jgi:hypothetical protein
MDADLSWQITRGSEVLDHIDDIAKFRMKYFRDFPYLYDGNLKYEKNYLRGYTQDEKSLLIIIRNLNNDIVGIATAIPLVTSSDILKETELLFSANEINPCDFYYCGEVILDYSIRSKGIVSKIFEICEKFASTNGFNSVAIATVIRSTDDPRNTSAIMDLDKLWGRMGFLKTNLTFGYSWPTIQRNGESIDSINQMIFWTKKVNQVG